MLREAQAAGQDPPPQRGHSVYDAGEVNGQVYIAMELDRRARRSRRWLRQQPRTWREILAIMFMAGEGLVAAHAAGLVHRDFKPDNVLVEDEGRPRVLDFGLARPAMDAAELREGARSPPLTLRPGREALRESLTLTGAGRSGRRRTWPPSSTWRARARPARISSRSASPPTRRCTASGRSRARATASCRWR